MTKKPKDWEPIVLPVDDLICAMTTLGNMTVADLGLLAHAIERELETRSKSKPKIRKAKR